MSTPETERKVRQLDNDVQAIYDLLSNLDDRARSVQGQQLRQGSRLDQIEDRLASVDTRLDSIDSQLATVTAAQQQQGQQLARIIELLDR